MTESKKWRVGAPTLGLFAEPSAGVLVDEMLFGMAVEILELDGEWARVRTAYRYEGYCLREALVESPDEPDAFVCSVSADVMSHPRYASEILLLLPRGALVKTLGLEGDWMRVGVPGGREGYMRGEHLALLAEYRKETEEEIRRQVVDLALSYLGTPYRWGGKSSWGIDCSGLTSIVYLLNGITIFRDAAIREDFGMHRIRLEEARPGDLLYFPGHVALYLGEGRYVHSTGASAGVVINSLVETHEDYRQDLAEGMTGIATVWRRMEDENC